MDAGGALNLTRESVDTQANPTNKLVSPFEWDEELPEGNQSPQYLQWLENNIAIPSTTEWHESRQERNLFSYYEESLPFPMTGTADVVIAKKAYIRTCHVSGRVIVVLELKKSIKNVHVNQAIGELILASIHSNYPVVVILTDLREEWIFYWLANGKIMEHSTGLLAAITIVEFITLTEQSETSPAQPSAYPPIATRLSFKSATVHATTINVLPGAEENVCLEQLLENRQKLDDFEIGADNSDIGNMKDFFDVMTNEERHKWKAKKILKAWLKCPSFHSGISYDDYIRIRRHYL